MTPLEMKFRGHRGVKSEEPSVEGYGYFLESHIQKILDDKIRLIILNNS